MQEKQPQLSIDVSDTTPYKCEQCGNVTFVQTYLIRNVSAVFMGSESILPIPVFECSNCGEIASWSIPEGINPTADTDIEAE